jgi:hypothetical protein
VPAAVVALAVALVAVAAFVGAEKVEQLMGGKAPPSPARPRRAVFATLAGLGAAGVVTLAVPQGTTAAPPAPARISAEALASRVVDAPWNVRVLDLRPAADCATARVPGAECAPPETLKDLYLADVAGARDLVVVAAGELAELPAEIRAYPGRVLALEGGFEAWRAYALTPPAPPAPGAAPEALAAFRARAGLHSALTGVKAPPPPAPVAGGAAKPRKKVSGGGCSG